MATAPLANNELECLKTENKFLKDFILNYNITYPIFKTKLLGTDCGNKVFTLPNDVYSNYKLYKINIYHDKNYTTGIEMFYKNNENLVKSFKFGEGRGIKKS